MDDRSTSARLLDEDFFNSSALFEQLLDENRAAIAAGVFQSGPGIQEFRNYTEFFPQLTLPLGGEHARAYARFASFAA